MRPAPPHSPEPLQVPRRRRRLLAAATLLVAASAMVSACGASTAPEPPSPAVLDARPAPSVAATTAPPAPSVAATTAPAAPSAAATTAPTAPSAAASTATPASPKKQGPSYVACGCGCCGGELPVSEHCLYHSKGDDLQKIINQDRASAKSPGCRLAGCSAGVLYSYCD